MAFRQKRFWINNLIKHLYFYTFRIYASKKYYNNSNIQNLDGAPLGLIIYFQFVFSSIYLYNNLILTLILSIQHIVLTRPANIQHFIQVGQVVRPLQVRRNYIVHSANAQSINFVIFSLNLLTLNANNCVYWQSLSGGFRKIIFIVWSSVAQPICKSWDYFQLILPLYMGWPDVIIKYLSAGK